MKVTPAIETLFSRIETGTYDAATRKILSLAKVQSVRALLLYYCNLETQGLFTETPNTEYTDTLDTMDFIAADGIALTTLYTAWKRPDIGVLPLICKTPKVQETITDMNGTDFLPYFLSHIVDKEKYRLVMCGAREATFQKAMQYAKNHFGFETVGQNGWDKSFDPSLLSKERTNIVLIARFAPKQEYWIRDHEHLWQEYRTIVIGIGGLFEFWAGTEMRAPALVRSLSLEWLWRGIVNPKKNLKKTLTSLKFFWRLVEMRWF